MESHTIYNSIVLEYFPINFGCKVFVEIRTTPIVGAGPRVVGAGPRACPLHSTSCAVAGHQINGPNALWHSPGPRPTVENAA